MEFNIGREKQGNVSGDADFDVCGRNDAFRGFDSETTWLAAGLLGFAILVLTLAGQDGHESVADHLKEQKLARDDASLQANPGTLSNKLEALSASTETTSGQMINVERTDMVISPGQSSSPPTESPMSPVQRQDTVRVIRPNIRNLRHRLHGGLRLDAKSRLIALWHESLARSGCSR
jgi:hypothetical protein